jgi:hypothetical protein
MKLSVRCCLFAHLEMVVYLADAVAVVLVYRRILAIIVHTVRFFNCILILFVHMCVDLQAENFELSANVEQWKASLEVCEHDVSQHRTAALMAESQLAGLRSEITRLDNTVSEMVRPSTYFRRTCFTA